MSATPQVAGSLDVESVKLTCDSIRRSVDKLRKAVPAEDEFTHHRLVTMENSVDCLEATPDLTGLFGLVSSVDALRSLYPAGR